jgi:hypothetical protein
MKIKALSDQEVASRRAVWSALSELFLDTDLDGAGLDRIGDELSRSPYTLDALDAILLWEVYPVCRRNLRSVAGEWAGFDPDWLESRILSGLSAWGMVWTGTVGRLERCSSVSWKRVRDRVTARRTGTEAERGA